MIDSWLEQFKTYWENHDVDGVLSLFHDEVEYWETPFKKLLTLDNIRHEWTTIRTQLNIRLMMSVFSENETRYAVTWDLSYANKSNEHKHWAGTYLIELNTDKKCTYFLQTGEQKI